MSRRKSIMNKHMADYDTPAKSKDANITHNKPHLFHTLREVFTYALSKGFNSIDVQHVRHTLKEAREKYPLQRRNPHEWKAMVIKHERKDWFENNRGVTPVKILQIQRKMGDWLLRIIDTDEQGWHCAMSWESGSWSDPVVHRSTGKKKIVSKKRATKTTINNKKSPKSERKNRFANIV